MFGAKIFIIVKILKLFMLENLPENLALIHCYEGEDGRSHCLVLGRDVNTVREVFKHLNNMPCIKYLVEDVENSIFRDLEDFE